MKITVCLPGALVVGLGFSGSTMAATPPPLCSAPRDLRGFSAGELSGANLVQQAWASVNDCDNREQFASIVMNNLDSISLPPESSMYVACRIAGVMAGAEEAVDAMWTQCDWQCSQEGTLMAQIGSKLYCNLSIRLGGLKAADQLIRMPVSLCGAEFQTTCDAAFLGQAQGDSQCYPYTMPPFDAAFRQAQNNQCTYTPHP
jgi:hypothetical protein